MVQPGGLIAVQPTAGLVQPIMVQPTPVGAAGAAGATGAAAAAAAPAAASGANDFPHQLAQLQELHVAGALTDDEFHQAKAILLENMSKSSKV